MSFFNNRYSSLLITLLLISLMVSSCGTTHQIRHDLKRHEKGASYFKGFVLYNPISKKEIINYNGTKYFTPASNTKLFTFYTAYKSLKDSVKSLAYFRAKDSLIIEGTADPSLFYGFDSTKVVAFLKNATDSIYLLDKKIDENPYGSGWAWDDYLYYYMPEKSLFPIYGNIVKYSLENDSLVSYPSYFNQYISVIDSVIQTRELTENKFYYAHSLDKKIYEVPFITSNSIVAEILKHLTQKKVKLITKEKEYDFTFLYGLNYDELYKKLLVDSDNHIAEQLMLQVGKEVANTYSVSAAIEYSLTNYLQELPQKPRWVDGSGLSRYNLFSPNDMVFLLDKMYREIPQQKLFDYFPVGGTSGTLKNWYGNDKPFVYAKSGSLSNNYNLSGYLTTKKGTLLIFSSMNNHFKVSSKAVKKDIEEILLEIYNTY